MSLLRWLALLWLACSPAFAADIEKAPPPTLELSFTPTDLAQIAVWVERDDGVFMETLALTYAVAKAGIGNRPGALQMNSGFRWPYGRREGVLPVWAHRRAAAPGAKPWKRVIFQNRSSEGFASLTVPDKSVDDYYCLSFQKDTGSRDALDAVTCASVFSSDKGRFITAADQGYAEPYESPDGAGEMRPLSLESLYPMRRDVDRCVAKGCYDHADVAAYKEHALEVMPELDAVTQATPQGQRQVTWRFRPGGGNWDHEHGYTLYVEVNVEGDYNELFDATLYPTPAEPEDEWDHWAKSYGYPYRGQPSVVYALPFTLEDEEVRVSEPEGYGALEGEDGDLRSMDGNITDDKKRAPGSGADRLRAMNGWRALLKVKRCEGAVGEGPVPEQVEALKVEPHPDRQRAHMWARLSFRTPKSAYPITQYDVKVKAEGSDWEQAFTPDTAQELLPVALDACADPEDPMHNRCEGLKASSLLSMDLAGLRQSTNYQVSVTARGAGCGASGPEAYAEFSTPARAFTTISPCFIASATYGSALASEIGVLRQFRDRYLASHGPGRWLVAAYYRLGPALAESVRAHTWLRTWSRAVLDPLVAAVNWWLS